jgi:hypothetical protein
MRTCPGPATRRQHSVLATLPDDGPTGALRMMALLRVLSTATLASCSRRVLGPLFVAVQPKLHWPFSMNVD